MLLCSLLNAELLRQETLRRSQVGTCLLPALLNYGIAKLLSNRGTEVAQVDRDCVAMSGIHALSLLKYNAPRCIRLL